MEALMFTQLYPQKYKTGKPDWSFDASWMNTNISITNDLRLTNFIRSDNFMTINYPAVR